MSVGNIRKLQENTAALYTERKTLRLKRPPLPSGYEISGEGGMMAKQNSSPGGMGYAARRKGDRLRVQGVGTRPPDDMERARLSGSTPFGFPKRICGALPYSDDSISYQDMLSRSLTKPAIDHVPPSSDGVSGRPVQTSFAPCIPDLLMAKDFKASVLHVSKLSIAFPWIPKNSPQSRIALVINFVDYSLNQRALAGHESAETPIGNESNGAVAGEAKENEKFYECWERYMEAINACPHHGFDTWLLVSYFYDGMSSSMKQLLETMCGGDFMSKNPEEVITTQKVLFDSL
uniref:Retrotransposon gag domain-containing protein n=1 Tax=Vitis vinifera TaxID=29760 RepID=A5BZ84_VITVI|nr:hypothetical protein VITISV_008748 [Vitis vinifera]